jgi:hypothetical protein
MSYVFSRKALIGHMIMCVQIKLRKDEEQDDGIDPLIEQRIEQGKRALYILKQMQEE